MGSLTSADSVRSAKLLIATGDVRLGYIQTGKRRQVAGRAHERRVFHEVRKPVLMHDLLAAKDQREANVSTRTRNQMGAKTVVEHQRTRCGGGASRSWQKASWRARKSEKFEHFSSAEIHWHQPEIPLPL